MVALGRKAEMLKKLHPKVQGYKACLRLKLNQEEKEPPFAKSSLEYQAVAIYSWGWGKSVE